MRIRMLRTLGAAPKQKPDRIEGQAYDVGDDEGKRLVGAGLAIELPAPAPKTEPKKPEAGVK
jgi:hypothetical protein